MQIDRPPARDTVLDCRRVRVVKGGRAVVQDIDWQVRANERWVVIGPNGAGKSSLLDVVSARAHPTAGEAWLLGERLGLVDVFDLRPRIGVVGPSVAAAIPPGERVLDAVVTAAWGTTAHWREHFADVDVARGEHLLDRLGIPGLRDRTFGTLSDGERGRVLVARALMPDPELLVLDEPAAGLDLGARESVVAMLAALAADPAAPAIVLVTHHVEEIPQDFTHALLLASGAVVAAGRVREVITGTALSRTFGIPVTVGRFAGRFFAVASPGAGAASPR